MPDTIEQALEILRATHDGNDPAPQHLKLIEMAVNGYFNEQGKTAFQELAENVRKGYQPPWFHGIENLTIDHIGYVYWKGHEVEHYTPRWAYTDEAKQAATELAERCKHLEKIAAEINCRNAIWKRRILYPANRKTSNHGSAMFHGIEHLTLDDEVWLRWKGNTVERFDPEFAQADAAKGKARILAAGCRHLEAIGKDVNKMNVVLTWGDRVQEPAGAGRVR